MPSPNTNSSPAPSRRLAVRMRSDLVCRRQNYEGRVTWVVKEPLGLNYFQFQEEEYAILQMLDGRASLEEIRTAFERRFAPQRIAPEEIWQFVSSLHRSGLVIAAAAGQGRQLKERHDERTRQQWLGKFTNVLALRFRGIDPERFLSALYPSVRWMFHPLVMVLCCLLAAAALLLVAVQFQTFQARLPAFQQFFSLENTCWLMLALAVTKILHEMGHGLACKHFGGECHEMGVMLLVLTPCLYCNVSDSWMLPGKWQRAAVGAAGMYVELVLASICTFLWWFSEPGLLHHLCLSTMFVCSVSTLLFNANPLLRYDGYYILSDLLEIPNLRQKSSRILLDKLGWWCLGLKPAIDPFLPRRRRWLFATYSVAAVVYRWVVVISILWFLNQVFEPYRLQVLGQLLAIVVMFGLVVMPLWKLGQFFCVPGRINQVNKPRLLATLAVASATVWCASYIPLPHHVVCPLELQPHDAAPVYVEVPGVLKDVLVESGQEVQPGRPLAMLDNIDVELAIAGLVAQRAQQEAQLASLRRQRFHLPQRSGQMAQVTEALKSIDEQLAKRRTDQQRLQLTAPKAGVILPPPPQGAPSEDDQELAMWSGTPLEPKNKDCHLSPGVLFCLIGDPKELQAVLMIDQGDIEFVRIGNQVEIKLDELPGETLTGVIEQISEEPLDISPRNLSTKTGGELPTITDQQGQERPQSASYQALVRITDEEGLLRLALRGRAKVHVQPMTLTSRLWRFLAQTFRFRA